ncbi:MAG: hypothetical protein AB7O24_04180 [Kofleriaceae bacterium]
MGEFTVINLGWSPDESPDGHEFTITEVDAVRRLECDVHRVVVVDDGSTSPADVTTVFTSDAKSFVSSDKAVSLRGVSTEAEVTLDLRSSQRSSIVHWGS